MLIGCVEGVGGYDVLIRWVDRLSYFLEGDDGLSVDLMDCVRLCYVTLRGG